MITIWVHSLVVISVCVCVLAKHDYHMQTIFLHHSYHCLVGDENLVQYCTVFKSSSFWTVTA